MNVAIKKPKKYVVNDFGQENPNLATSVPKRTNMRVRKSAR